MIIDDATRLVVNCKICERQDTWNVLDSFWQALELYGIPERIFTDNGSQYVSWQLTQVCAKLGIKKLRARPRRASAKGKVEAFNRYLDSFVQEVKLKRPQRAVEVQHYLDIWLSELYQRKPHSALNGKTPTRYSKKMTNP